MKTLKILALAGLSAALATPALAQDALPLRINPFQQDVGQGIGAAGTRTPEFRAEALRSDAVSIEASRIALERSRNPRVRDYAQRKIEVRKATTDALLPEGTSLTAGGSVVSDRSGFETRLDNPVGLVLAPVTIAANIGTGIVGGVLGGAGIIDNSPTEPGRRVAIGPQRQERLERLRSARSAREFDRTYLADQARSDERTLALYDTYARNGDSAAGRTFANQALPYIANEHAHSARLADRIGG